MNIVREPLRKGEGRRRITGGYGNMTTNAAHELMALEARMEAEGRKDVKEVKISGAPLSGRSTATLIGTDGKPVARYVQSWPQGRKPQKEMSQADEDDLSMEIEVRQDEERGIFPPRSVPETPLRPKR